MNKYAVYEHIFPNGKRYIGITSTSPEDRWRGGDGYKTQPKMHRAISKYGWGNIEHNVIVDGLSCEQARALEKYLIGSLNTIENGYNATIGGENIKTCYLSSYVLAMLRYAKRNGITSTLELVDGNIEIVELADGDRNNEPASNMWNEASDAVCRKHKIFSTTDFRDVSEFWWHMMEYYSLWLIIQSGHDVTGWKEPPYSEQFLW